MSTSAELLERENDVRLSQRLRPGAPVRALRSGRRWIIHQYLDVLLGYSWYDDRYRMKNLVQLTSTGDFIDTPPPGSYPGLDSTFHFHWEGLKIGIREDTGITEHWRAIGIFSYSPFMSYRGDGFWNLRPDFRPPSPPSFTQSRLRRISSKASCPCSTARSGGLPSRRATVLIYFHSHAGSMTSFMADGLDRHSMTWTRPGASAKASCSTRP